MCDEGEGRECDLLIIMIGNKREIEKFVMNLHFKHQALDQATPMDKPISKVGS